MENHNRPTEAVSRDIAAFVLISWRRWQSSPSSGPASASARSKRPRALKRHRQELALSDELSPFPITRARTVRTVQYATAL